MAVEAPFPEAARTYLRVFEEHRQVPSEENFIRRQTALDNLLFHTAWSPVEQREYLERLQARAAA